MAGKVNESVVALARNLQTVREQAQLTAAEIAEMNRESGAVLTRADIAQRQRESGAVLTGADISQRLQGSGAVRTTSSGGGGGGGASGGSSSSPTITRDPENTEAVNQCTQAMIDNLEELRRINEANIELQRIIRQGEDNVFADRRRPF